jgi:hypothetical protein
VVVPDVPTAVGTALNVYAPVAKSQLMVKPDTTAPQESTFKNGGVALVSEVTSPGYAPLLAEKASEAVDNAFNVALAEALLAVIFARSRLGMAIAANSAIMATTIIISTRVKPDCFFIASSSFGLYGAGYTLINKEK